MRRSLVRISVFMMLASAAIVHASETKPATGADEWRNPNRQQVRTRNVVKVQLEGTHLEVKDNKISRVQGVKTIPLYGIKVVKVVDKEGKELTDFKGASILYYDSKKGKELVAKHESGNEIIVHGKLDLDLAILEVEKVELSSIAKRSKENLPTGN